MLPKVPGSCPWCCQPTLWNRHHSNFPRPRPRLSYGQGCGAILLHTLTVSQEHAALGALTFSLKVLRHSQWNLRYWVPQKQIQHCPETIIRLVKGARGPGGEGGVGMSSLIYPLKETRFLACLCLAQHQGLVMEGKPLYLNLRDRKSLQTPNPTILLSKITLVSQSLCLIPLRHTSLEYACQVI